MNNYNRLVLTVPTMAQSATDHHLENISLTMSDCEKTGLQKCVRPAVLVICLLVTILAIAGAVTAHMMETARGLFIAIIVLSCVTVIIVIISKVGKSCSRTSYQVNM